MLSGLVAELQSHQMAQGKNQCLSLHDPQVLIIASCVNREHGCLSPPLATLSPVNLSYILKASTQGSYSFLLCPVHVVLQLSEEQGCPWPSRLFQGWWLSEEYGLCGSVRIELSRSHPAPFSAFRAVFPAFPKNRDRH